MKNIAKSFLTTFWYQIHFPSLVLSLFIVFFINSSAFCIDNKNDDQKIFELAKIHIVKGTEFYKNSDFSSASSELKKGLLILTKLSDSINIKQEMIKANLYLALTNVGLNHLEYAETYFRRLLEIAPVYELDSSKYSRKIIILFNKVKNEFFKEQFNMSYEKQKNIMNDNETELIPLKIYNMFAIGIGNGAYSMDLDKSTSLDSTPWFGIFYYTRFFTPLIDKNNEPYALREFLQHPSSASLLMYYLQSPLDFSTMYNDTVLNGDGDTKQYQPEIYLKYFSKQFPNLGFQAHYFYQNNNLNTNLDTTFQNILLHLGIELKSEKHSYGGGCIAYLTPITQLGIYYLHNEQHIKLDTSIILENISDSEETATTDSTGNSFQLEINHFLFQKAIVGVNYSYDDEEDFNEQNASAVINYYWNKKISTSIRGKFGKQEPNDKDSDTLNYTDIYLTTRMFIDSKSSVYLQYVNKSGDMDEGYQILAAFKGFF